jgi:hypothetical protein
MNRFDRSLARTTIDVYAATAGEEYALLMDKLNGSIGTVAVSGFEESERQARENRLLVTNATKILPQLEPYVDDAGFKGGNNYATSPFIVDSQGTAKFLQHNTIWFTPKGRRMPPTAYYIIGIEMAKKDTSVILAAALRGGSVPQVLGVDMPKIAWLQYKTKDIKTYLDYRQIALGTPYSREQLGKKYLYNPDSKKFLIDSGSPGSWCAEDIGKHESWSLDTLTDSGMARFDVIGHLTKIATMLGVNSKLQELVDPTPIQAQNAANVA